MLVTRDQSRLHARLDATDVDKSVTLAHEGPNLAHRSQYPSGVYHSPSDRPSLSALGIVFLAQHSTVGVYMQQALASNLAFVGRLSGLSSKIPLSVYCWWWEDVQGGKYYFR